jgi:hypothetical protein
MPMIRKLSIVVLALSMSAASAYAMAPMKGHMMKGHHMMMHKGMMCAEGQTKAACMCGSKNMATGGKPQMCKAGQWCHSFNGMCTM